MSNYDPGDFSNDGFTEVTHRSWFERIGSSIKGVLFGLLLVVVSCALMFWNEGRAVKTARALTEGAGIVVSVPSNKIDPAREGKLIHTSGDTTATGDVRDPELGVAAKGLKLSRNVEMYQWKEVKESKTRKKLGGGEETVTTYRYVREWSSKHIDSSRFRRQRGHVNPSMPSTGSKDFAAEGAKLGAFKLGNNVIGSLGSGETFSVPDSAAQTVTAKLGANARIEQGGIYVGGNPNAPRVGDVRISYKVLPLQTVSVVAKQQNGGFTAYTASNGRSILLANTGSTDAAQMFQTAQDSNTMLTWGIRLFGALLLFAGWRLVFGPIVVFADFIPLIGNIAGFGAGLIALILTAIIAPTVIAIAWLFYRPIVSAIIFAVGIAIAIGLRQWGRSRAPAAESAPA